MVELDEAGGATFHAVVQIDHERPGAIASNAGDAVVLVRAGREVVMVTPELLAHIVALGRDAFGIRHADSQGLADLLVDRERGRRFQMAEFGGRAGSHGSVAIAIPELRGTQVMTDERSELRAFAVTEKILERV